MEFRIPSKKEKKKKAKDLEHNLSGKEMKALRQKAIDAFNIEMDYSPEVRSRVRVLKTVRESMRRTRLGNGKWIYPMKLSDLMKFVEKIQDKEFPDWWC